MKGPPDKCGIFPDAKRAHHIQHVPVCPEHDMLAIVDTDITKRNATCTTAYLACRFKQGNRDIVSGEFCSSAQAGPAATDDDY